MGSQLCPMSTFLSSGRTTWCQNLHVWTCIGSNSSGSHQQHVTWAAVVEEALGIAVVETAAAAAAAAPRISLAADASSVASVGLDWHLDVCNILAEGDAKGHTWWRPWERWCHCCSGVFLVLTHGCSGPDFVSEAMTKRGETTPQQGYTTYMEL